MKAASDKLLGALGERLSGFRDAESAYEDAPRGTYDEFVALERLAAQAQRVWRAAEKAKGDMPQAEDVV